MIVHHIIQKVIQKLPNFLKSPLDCQKENTFDNYIVLAQNTINTLFGSLKKSTWNPDSIETNLYLIEHRFEFYSLNKLRLVLS